MKQKAITISLLVVLSSCKSQSESDLKKLQVLDPSDEIDISGMSLDEICLKGYEKPGITIAEIDSTVYRLAFQRNERHPELASPTLEIIGSKEGNFGRGLVYQASTRNVMDPKEHLEVGPAHQEVQPNLSWGTIRRLNYKRDVHGYFINLHQYLHEDLVDFLQFDITPGKYTFPSSAEMRASWLALAEYLPTWNQPQLSITSLETGKIHSPRDYLHSFIYFGSVPWGKNGWMFYHDLLVHVQALILVPPKLLKYMRTRNEQVLAFIDWIKREYRNNERLTSHLELKMEDLIDFWSVRILEFYQQPDPSTGAWFRTGLTARGKTLAS